MALSNHFTYLPTIDAFTASWALADAEAGGAGVVLADGTDQAALQGLRGDLAGALEAVRKLEMDARLAAGQLSMARRAVLGRLGEFTRTARAWWSRSPLAGSFPMVPRDTAALDKFLRPVRDALRLWARINAGPPSPGVTLPLQLGVAGDFARADLEALRDECLTSRDAGEEAEFELGIARRVRDGWEKRVREVLAAYGAAADARLGALSPVVASLPRLYPLPGHTPDPVPATAAWDDLQSAAQVAWEASTDPKLAGYGVRWCPGETYDKKEERLAGRTGKEGRSLRTTEGLESPGDAVTYKVYVLLTTENERGSKPVTVRRPLPPP